MYEELMTEEESVFAYDLGEMYAVIPTAFEKSKYESFYKTFSHPKVGKYTSQMQKCITKEQIRKLILNENLI